MVTWLRVFRVPYHAWSFDFFKFLANRVGTYICSDDQTLKAVNMDVGRFMVRTHCSRVLNKILKVKIDGVIFNIKIVEDLHGLIRINLNNEGLKPDQRDCSSSDSEKIWNHEDKGKMDREECDGLLEDSTSGKYKGVLFGIEVMGISQSCELRYLEKENNLRVSNLGEFGITNNSGMGGWKIEQKALMDLLVKL